MASSVGERLAHGLSNGAQFVGEGLQQIGCAGGLWMWRFDEREQSTGTLDQSAHGIGVALPVAGKLPVLNLCQRQSDLLWRPA